MASGSADVECDSSLLLAYLGRVTGDQAMAVEGLRGMANGLRTEDRDAAALYERLRDGWGSDAVRPDTASEP
jgi:hypothetical protein